MQKMKRERKDLKNSLIEKLLDKKNEVIFCTICGKEIFKIDIQMGQFEYIENVHNNYFHKKCIKKEGQENE